jgi:hypothetical protein
MAVNNNGNLLDSSSNVAVDFVWGNVPMQPNDDRAASISNFGGTTGTNQIQYQTAEFEISSQYQNSSYLLSHRKGNGQEN